MTAVSESAALTESMLETYSGLRDPLESLVKTLNVNRTSSARTGCPSRHRARGLRLNAIESESGAHFQLVANCGTKPESPTVFRLFPISASLSKTELMTAKSNVFRAWGGNKVSTSV